MNTAIATLTVLNVLLAVAWFVAAMARMDQRYSARVKAREDYKSHFRRDRRWDD